MRDISLRGWGLQSEAVYQGTDGFSLNKFKLFLFQESSLLQLGVPSFCASVGSSSDGNFEDIEAEKDAGRECKSASGSGRGGGAGHGEGGHLGYQELKKF